MSFWANCSPLNLWAVSHKLLANNKINYVAKADYSKGEMLETIVKAIIKSDKINFNLKELSKVQKNS